MRKFFVASVLLSGLVFSQLCFASEVDSLVNKLVEKGILSAGEAQTMLIEAKEDAKLDIAKGKNEVLPLWIQTFKMKGDFRARYQMEEKETARVSTNRSRARIRLRVGTEAKVNDNTKAYFGLASGGTTDPRSTNQTFDNGWSKKAITIDYAYADYLGFNDASVSLGKLAKMPVWEPGDMLWDTDLTPEGIAWLLKKGDFFVNTGAFLLDESSSSSEIYTYMAQVGMAKSFETLDLKAAVAFYGFGNIQGGPALDYPSNTNTSNRQGLVYEYNSFSPAVEVTFKEVFGLPIVGLFAEYVSNPDPAKNNEGYMGGVKFGAAKVEGFGQWQGIVNYVKLERDAWVDAFPDSDRYSGGTHIKGYEWILAFGLAKNLTLNLDFYSAGKIGSRAQELRQELFQVDLNFKF